MPSLSATRLDKSRLLYQSMRSSSVTDHHLLIRKAAWEDVPFIIALLVDDDLQKLNEAADPETYGNAFRSIDGDPNQLLAVAELQGEIVACLQMTFIPGLARKGMWRAHIEAVRVARRIRGHGIGKSLFTWAIDCARQRGCGMMQLMADDRRTEAHRFYEQQGFAGNHRGFRLYL